MKFAILGLGHIAKRVAKGIQFAKNAELYALASRDLHKAEKFMEEAGAQRAYGSYEEMLRDRAVDVVYICTPNPLHYEHIMLALKHHKHVICEKPLVSDMEQLHACFAFAKQQACFLMEAEKTLFTPLNQLLKQKIEEGIIGKLHYIEAGYGANMKLGEKEKDSWLFREQDGGSFYDVGVYPICYANYFAGSEIVNIQLMKQCAHEGYEETTQGMLGYENGVMAYVRSSWTTDLLNRGVLYGDKGYILTENFWKSTSAYLVVDGKEEIIEVEMNSDFTGEIEHACTCIEEGRFTSPILGEYASEQIMKVLEELHKGNCVQVEKSVK